jgi:hypothetical protein
MLIAFALAFCSCFLLCSSMNRHTQQIWPTYKISPARIMLLRVIGWLLVLTTTIYCTRMVGISTGLVVLCGIFSLAIALLALLLNYAARWIPAIGIFFIAAGFIY